MKHKKHAKINTSSLQVLKTLLCLWEKEYTMTDLVSELNKRENRKIFNNSIVSKYINTCRYCGFNIPRVNGKYYVANTPFKIDLEEKDLELIKELQILTKTRLSPNVNKKFDKFLEKLSRLSNQDIVKIEKKNVELVFEKFEKAMTDSKKIVLECRNNEKLECCPIDIVENKGKTFFKVYDGNSEVMIPMDNTLTMEITDIRFKNNFPVVTVLYKLTGDLMKRYSLKENEEILEKKSDYMLISCKGEDKEILLSRLLRYDNCCEVISPREYREEMKQIIKGALANYGV